MGMIALNLLNEELIRKCIVYTKNGTATFRCWNVTVWYCI